MILKISIINLGIEYKVEKTKYMLQIDAIRRKNDWWNN